MAAGGAPLAAGTLTGGAPAAGAALAATAALAGAALPAGTPAAEELAAGEGTAPPTFASVEGSPAVWPWEEFSSEVTDFKSCWVWLIWSVIFLTHAIMSPPKHGSGASAFDTAAVAFASAGGGAAAPGAAALGVAAPGAAPGTAASAVAPAAAPASAGPAAAGTAAAGALPGGTAATTAEGAAAA